MKKFYTVYAPLFLMMVGAGFFQIQDAFGFAYRYPTQSTLGLAKGNAVLTEENEPSSVYYNPAATAFSSGVQVSMGSQFVTSQTGHEYGPLGVDETSIRTNLFVPNFFTTVNLKALGIEPVTLGFGVESPFGLGVQYRKGSPIAPVIEKASLRLANYSLTSSYKVNDQLALGAGLDIGHSNALLQNRVDYGALVGAPRAFDGIAKFTGDDTHVGFNASALWKPIPNHALAFTFRSQQWADLEGKVQLRRNPAFTGLPPKMEGDAEARVNYPMIVEGGYGLQLGKLKLEFVLDWTRWENVNDLVIRSKSNPFIPDLAYAADFNNVFTYNGSAAYALCPALDLYLGFIWAETPIPQHTFNAIVPDSDRFGLSCGLGWKCGKAIKVDTGFQWVHFEGRSISNSVGAPITTVNGNYDTDAFVVGANVTYKF